MLASLATFGVGLAARPVGAVLCGYLGDKFGRRNLLLITVSLMGFSSVLMGFLPTYAQVGIWAPILLVTLRIVQGFALGGESTGAQLMAVEHAHADRRGKYSGLLSICSPISQILANATMLLLSSQMSPEAFLSYGWRIPFWLSFILVLVGIYIRLRVSETPSFVELQHSKVAQVSSPLRDVLRFHYKDVLRLMLFFCGPTALFYLVVIFSLGYITGTLGVSKQMGFALLMGANACAIVGALACRGIPNERSLFWFCALLYRGKSVSRRHVTGLGGLASPHIWRLAVEHRCDRRHMEYCIVYNDYYWSRDAREQS